MKRLILLAAIALAPAYTQTLPFFTLAPTGCSATHCNQHEDDATGIAPPLATFGLLFSDTTINGNGSGSAVGCAGNGSIDACNYVSLNSGGGNSGRLYVYNAAGTVLWTDRTQTNALFYLGAGTCNAPVVGADGGVISADENQIIRWSPTGAVLWQTPTPYQSGGSPTISANGFLPSYPNGNGAGYPCGGIKVMANGAVVIKTVTGPLAAFNSSTGALIGPAACAGDTCALWPGQTPGTFCATSDYYVSVKEGGGAHLNRIYDTVQGTGAGGVGGCTGTAIPLTQGALIGIDVSLTTGLSIGATSTTFSAQSVASPVVVIQSGAITVFSDIGSCKAGNALCPPTVSGLNSAVMEWTDNGSSFSTLSGFPVTTASMTTWTGLAQATVQNIQAGGSSATNTVTFPVTGAGSTTGCVVADSALIVGNSVTAYNGNWPITSGGVVANTSVRVAIAGVIAGNPPGANGTITCNNAGTIQANFAGDTRGCLWMYINGNSALYCIDEATGAIDFSLDTIGLVPPGEISFVCGADRTMSVNGANGHNIMVSSFNGNSSYVSGLDMNLAIAGAPNGTQAGAARLWYYLNGITTATNNAAGQFPSMLSANGLPEVIFTNSTTGVKILGIGGTFTAPNAKVAPKVTIQ